MWSGRPRPLPLTLLLILISSMEVIRTEVQVNSSGQECPLHINTDTLPCGGSHAPFLPAFFSASVGCCFRGGGLPRDDRTHAGRCSAPPAARTGRGTDRFE